MSMRSLAALAAVLLFAAPAAFGAPALTLTSVPAAESKAAIVRVVVTGTAAAPIAFTLTTAGGTATAGVDYAAVSRKRFEITRSTDIEIRVLDDTEVEPDETFFVEIADVTNASAAPSRVLVTIGDDDALPVPQVANVVVTEGNGYAVTTARITVTLPRPLIFPLSLPVGAGFPATATSWVDWNPTFGEIITFAPGETSSSIGVHVIGDNYWEPDETLRVYAGRASGELTIIDDDLPNLLVEDVWVHETTGAPARATFRLRLSSRVRHPVSVAYAITPVTATPDVDYAAVSSRGTVTLAPGEVVAPIDVTVTGDANGEASEQFDLQLSAVTGAHLVRDVARATIIDDDVPVARSVSIDDVTLFEPTGATRAAVFRVRLSAPSTSTVTVAWRTVAGTATAPADFEEKEKIVSFAPGDVMEEIAVSIVGDGVIEPDERFSVVLSDPIGATLHRYAATATILDEDPSWMPPRVHMWDAEGTENDTWSNARVHLAVSSLNFVSSDGWVQVRMVGGTVSERDVSWTPARNVQFRYDSLTTEYVILIHGDQRPEHDETLVLELFCDRRLLVPVTSAIVTIVDDDQVPRRRSARP